MTMPIATNSVAQDRATCAGAAPPQGVVVAINGEVTAREPSGRAFPIAVGTPLCARDEITTGANARIEFRLAGKDTTTGSSSNSVTVIPDAPNDCIDIRSGIVAFISSVTGSQCFRTPLIDAGIDGTEALIAVDGATGDSFVLVREGIVSVRDRRLRPSQSARIRLAASPVDPPPAAFATLDKHLTRATAANTPLKFREFLLRPDDATDWAIYYPPVLFAADLEAPALREAAELLGAGQPDKAVAMLEQAPLQGREKAAALALRSIAAIFRNRLDAGSALAEEAIASDPSLAAGHVAQSYALQALGRLDAARTSAERAVEVAPNEPYSWARLAELRLALGAQRDARNAVMRSLEIEETALARTIEGFSALARNDFDAARTALRRAVEIDSAPLAHLGLGLASIKQGNVSDGRLEIETAVALGPKDANLRMWLGRAYLAEGRAEKAAAQLAIAKKEDPDEPNAFLFDGLRLYTENRPVEALHAIEEAQRRGGARAPIRGSLGLGEDAAVRSTALGRVYDVLGFEELSLQEAARAADFNPASPAAHRFLFDSYRGRPGFEIAQASELFRYQFLSPPSNDPVQPSLAEADLGVLAIPGPTRVTFHEFAPLFQTEGFSGYASGSIGNNGVFGDEVSLTLLDGNTSVSVGQFHSQTDGFRDNDDVTHDVVTALLKHAPIPELTLTAEARLRSTDEGDRFLRAADDDPFASILRTDSDRALLRFGAHVQPTERLDLLAVGTYSELNALFDDDFGDPFFDSMLDEESSTLSFEAQGIYRFHQGHITVGGTITDTTNDSVFSDIFGPLAIDRETDQHSLYAYGTVTPIENVDLTVGLSYDASEDRFQFVDFGGPDITEVSQFNPKIGLRAEVIDGVTIRAAYFRTSKKAFVADQTLEPTTIAGFNQFFDDFNQTDGHSYGAGIDIQLTSNLWAGAEYLHRDLEIPSFDLDAFGNTIPVTLDGTEQRITGYLNATAGPNWAFTAGVDYSRNETEVLDRPDEVETLLVPVSARYFHPSGFFAAAQAIWFDQESVARAQGGFAPPATDTDESGVVVNAAIGYRLPNNRGQISLEINNLLDEDLRLQNSLNNSARPSTRPLAEDLSIVGRVTVAF